MAEKQVSLTPEQRALAFAKFTRQYMQVLPAISATENGTISFDLPKARLINKIRLLILDTITVTHAANATFTPAIMAPFNYINNIRVTANNGFSPYNISGVGIYLYDLLHNQANVMSPVTEPTALAATASRARNKLGLEAGVAGVANPLQMVVDLPLALNDKNPVGLWLAQTDDTVITVTISFNDADILNSAIANYTMASGGITVVPMVESFSIPKLREAFPDISMLKLVQEQNQTIAGAGQVDVKLPTGLTYRKIIAHITDALGAGVTDATLLGNMELIFNQADIPYSIRPLLLSAINQEHYGVTLPDGVFVFDFASFQGLANYAGSRDLIDTEKITEFWFRFQAGAAGNVRIVSEMLSKLR